MPKKQKGPKKAKKTKRTFGKPVDVTGVAGGVRAAGCGCTGMPQDPVGER
jgi:hypothetical protein